MTDKAIQFDKKSLDKAEKDYQNVFPKGIQSDIIKELIDVAVKYIPISKSAMGGIFLNAIADWQTKNKMELGELVDKTPEERMQGVLGIMKLASERLKNMLTLVSEADRVQKAFDQARNLYQEKYSKR